MKREITIDEWNQYNWIQVEPGNAQCVRGIKLIPPPDDGYKYLETTAFADSEQKWTRAYELIRETPMK